MAKQRGSWLKRSGIRFLSVLTLCLLLISNIQVSEAARATVAPEITSSAVATPNPVDAGSTATITADVKSSTDLTALIDVEIYDPAGNRAHAQVYDNQSLKAEDTWTQTFDWAVPATADPGTYTIHIGVFSAGWGTQYDWNWAAGSVTVNGTTAPPPATTYESTATVTPDTAFYGETVNIAASVTGSVTSTVHVDVEVYSPTGAKVHQQVFADQTLEGGVAYSFPVAWVVPDGAAEGTYTVDIGLFSTDWSENPHWHSAAAAFAVTAAGTEPPPAPASFNVVATASPDPIMAGNKLTIATTVTAGSDSNILLDVEVYDAQGVKVFQNYWDNQTLTAGVEKTYTTYWQIPAAHAAGTYTISVGIFGPGWGDYYDWQSGLDSFVIELNPDPTAPPPLPPAPATLPAKPAALPDYFSLGVTAGSGNNGILGWMPNSGVNWDYAYQYLTGGVNTGEGWATWGGNPYWALDYAKAADQRGYMSVFTYYQLLHSTGPGDAYPETEEDLAHLNDPVLMKAYFEDFIKLMKQIGNGTHDGVQGFGKPIIVHVEPDLTAYAQQAVLDNSRCYGYCIGEGNDPALLKASVASSGVPEVAGFPDTYQGYQWAMLHIRDLYAPNAVMATHVSGWTTLYDIGGDTSPGLDAAGLGQIAGEFAARSGTRDVPAGSSTYDLIFNDVGDHDAGYYKYAGGKQNAFWDRTNRVFPNFYRWEEYMGNIVSTAGKRAMIWQIPIGNQVMRTMNNTYGHYQDNRVEYFMAHMDELARQGIIGLLFGRGNYGSTTHWNEQQDTPDPFNPDPVCTTDGMGTGETICNDQVAVYTDDDGGYLRITAQEYYANGTFPLP